MPKALVTGALGHTGTFMIDLLVKKGWDVVGTDLDGPKRKSIMCKETIFNGNFKNMSVDHPKVKFIAADLTDPKSLEPLFSLGNNDYDVIFHTASLYDYFASYEILMNINVKGLSNLITAMETTYDNLEKYPRFIHWSTCGVYGVPKYNSNQNGFILEADENTPCNPINNYSISKTEQEKIIIEFAKRSGLEYTILRSMPIYGPHQTYGMFHVFYMINKMRSMPLPIIYPKKNKLVMPMVHVEDLVNAALFLSLNDKAIGEVFNVGGENVTQEDFLEFVYQELGINYAIIPIWYPIYKLCGSIASAYIKNENKKARKWGLRPKIDEAMSEYINHQYYFSNKKIKNLGFQFKYANPFEGVRQTIKWYVNSGWFDQEEFHLLNNIINAGEC